MKVKHALVRPAGVQENRCREPTAGACVLWAGTEGEETDGRGSGGAVEASMRASKQTVIHWAKIYQKYVSNVRSDHNVWNDRLSLRGGKRRLPWEGDVRVGF